MLYNLLAAGSFWFWCLIFLPIFWFTYYSADDDHEKTGDSIFFTFLMLCLLAFTTLFTDFNPFVWVYNNPWLTAFGVALYFILGQPYWILKWKFFVNDQFNFYKKNEKDYRISYQKILDQRPDWKETYQEFIQAKGFPPQLSENKAKVFFWMTWWPFSLVWTTFHDLGFRIKDALYNFFATFAQKISDNKFKDHL